MALSRRAIERADELLGNAIRRGLGRRTAEDECLNGRTLRLDGRDLLHFGSCSYLGLELDPRLKEGAMRAAQRFGAHFSSSRIYMSSPPYRQLEELLEAIFGTPVVVAASTTLAHLAALPVLCESSDAWLIDHQAHHSLQLAASQLRPLGAVVEVLEHSRLDRLEERLEALRATHPRIWYAADGVYSMHGDLAPLDALVALLDRHSQLHLYIDDAHGVSCWGPRGQGYALQRLPLRHQVVVTTTLGKSFGAGGAVIVTPCAEWRERIQRCGGPMLFSGPVPPPMLGAAIASARIHLSDEIAELQHGLRSRMQVCNEQLRLLGLPLLGSEEVPVRFIETGHPEVAQALSEYLLEQGFFCNVALFPAVPLMGAGIRFTLTLHQSEADVRALTEAIQRGLPEAHERHRRSLGEVSGFGLDPGGIACGSSM